MMLHKDPKKLAALIVVGKGKPSYDEMKAENSEMNQNLSEVSDGLKAAADEILSAIETKDSTALAKALKNAYTMCEEEE